MKTPVLLWFRNDLRLSDNPALCAAVDTGQPIIAVYIRETDALRPRGAAGDYWLHHSLNALQKDIEGLGGVLSFKRGKAREIIEQAIETHGVSAVFWNRRYDKGGRAVDEALKSALKKQDITVQSFNGNLLTEPWEVETKSGGYYKVFTPYWRAARDRLSENPHKTEPSHTPDSLEPFKDFESEALSDWDLLPTQPDWGSKMNPYWTPGSKGARQSLKDFLDGPVERYSEDRNRPDVENGTSHLSPHLAFGEISPREIWTACRDDEAKAEKFLSEIGWREFSYVLLYHNPELPRENYKSDFDDFAWEEDAAALERWQHGQTGYPFVDAGMRQLWATGWQHNRVRMVTASFLIKHLLIHWKEGEAWFWDTLVDADPASNAAGWQWVAGSGADASPYFRIFNPFTQGEKFDPKGDYVRKYVPELKDLPNKYLNRPWEAPDHVLKKANVVLGKTYPKPIVDHKTAREKALSAYKASRD